MIKWTSIVFYVAVMAVLLAICDTYPANDAKGIKATGVKDATGLKDAVGIKGAAGTKDAAGINGAAGIKGAAGTKDATGIKGAVGSSASKKLPVPREVRDVKQASAEDVDAVKKADGELQKAVNKEAVKEKIAGEMVKGGAEKAVAGKVAAEKVALKSN